GVGVAAGGARKGAGGGVGAAVDDATAAEGLRAGALEAAGAGALADDAAAAGGELAATLGEALGAALSARGGEDSLGAGVDAGGAAGASARVRIAQPPSTTPMRASAPRKLMTAITGAKSRDFVGGLAGSSVPAGVDVCTLASAGAMAMGSPVLGPSDARWP